MKKFIKILIIIFCIILLRNSYSQNSVTFKGLSGTVTSGLIMSVKGDLNVQNNNGNNGEINNNGVITLTGNLNNNGFTSFGNGELIFNGSAPQSIFGNIITGRLTLNNSISSITALGNITVNTQIKFIKGILNTSNANLLTLTKNATVFGAKAGDCGATDLSYVNGPMVKTGNTNFIFPIGKTKSKIPLHPIGFELQDTTTVTFQAEYFKTPPINAKQIENNVKSLNPVEYWDLDRTSGNNNAYVTLNWKKLNITNSNDLLVAHFDNKTKNKWESKGKSSVSGTIGANSYGTIRSELITSFSPFTIGSMNNNNWGAPPSLWTGTISSDWNIGDNWDTEMIPISTCDLTIPATPANQPVIDTGTVGVCHNLTINAGASLSVNGVLNMEGYLILKSDATGSGAITQSDAPAAINITGTAKVERFIPSSGYHYISFPVTGLKLSQVAGFALSAGNTGFWMNPDIPLYAKNFPNIWRMVEAHTHNTNYDQNCWWAPPGTEVMVPTYGYTMNFTGSVLLSTTVAGSALNKGDYQVTITKSASSTDLLHNNVKIDIFGKTDKANGVNYGTGPGNGWNVVGNPYPSPIDWKAVKDGGGIGSNISIGFAEFKPTAQYTGIYGYYNPYGGATGAFSPSRYIAAGQTFLVLNTATGNSSLTLKNSYRTVSYAAMHSLLKKGSEMEYTFPKIRLSAYISKNEQYRDETLLMFIDGANKNFDIQFDAKKLMNNDERIPNIYSIISDDKYAMKALPKIENNLTIPLNIKVNTIDKYTINASDIENLPEGINVYLVDTKTGKTQDLKANPLYSFKPDNNDSARFYLKFTDSQIENLTDTIIKEQVANEQIPVVKQNDEMKPDRKDAEKIVELTPETIAPPSNELEPVVSLNEEIILNAKEAEKKVELSWSTTSESNTDMFIIERSRDGNEYREIGTVKGAGYSSSELKYNFIDEHPLTNKSYYRLKQTSYDGNSLYFKPVAVSIKAEQNLEMQIYPNPSDGKNINIRIKRH